MDGPILQMRKLRCTEAESQVPRMPGHSPYSAPRGLGALAHTTGPSTQLGQTLPWASSPPSVPVGPDLGRLLHASVPTCRPSKTPISLFSTCTAPSTLKPPHGPLGNQLSFRVPSWVMSAHCRWQGYLLAVLHPSPQEPFCRPGCQLPLTPATGNPHLKRPLGCCRVTILFTVKQLHSYLAVRRWVSVLRSSCCRCQQPCVWGTFHDDLWEGGGKEEGCGLLP